MDPKDDSNPKILYERGENNVFFYEALNSHIDTDLTDFYFPEIYIRSQIFRAINASFIITKCFSTLI